MQTIEFTDGALVNLKNMMRRVWDIENQYGATSEESLKASWSLLRAHHTIFQWGGRIHAEDDLSLIINSSITIGVIWFAKKIPKTYEDGTIALDRDPLLGEWSMHS